MAELLLTDEEKTALSWLDLSDDALGKLCRKACLVLMEKDKTDDSSDDRQTVWASTAGMFLCGLVDDANADTATFLFEGLTNGERERGNWKVTIEKLEE